MTRDKLSYTEDEVNELIHWFDNRTLPKDLRLDAGNYVRDTAAAVKTLIFQLGVNHHEKCMVSYIRLLDWIRQEIINKEKGDSPAAGDKQD